MVRYQFLNNQCLFFSNYVLFLDEPPIVFKAQLFALSGVQPERQKIMVKGQTIGDIGKFLCKSNFFEELS